MTDQTASDHRYWAFISYSNKDAAHARWLHRGIETYGIPAKVVEPGHATPSASRPSGSSPSHEWVEDVRGGRGFPKDVS